MAKVLLLTIERIARLTFQQIEIHNLGQRLLYFFLYNQSASIKAFNDQQLEPVRLYLLNKALYSISY